MRRIRIRRYEGLRRRVARCLQGCEAASEGAVADTVAAGDRRDVRRALLSLVNDGDVEVLTPVGGVRGRQGSRPDRDHVYYRLVRPTDHSFLWEQHIGRRVRVA